MAGRPPSCIKYLIYLAKPMKVGSKGSLKGKPKIFKLTVVPILRVPALAFLYLLGKAEAEGRSGSVNTLGSL